MAAEKRKAKYAAQRDECIRAFFNNGLFPMGPPKGAGK